MNTKLFFGTLLAAAALATPAFAATDEEILTAIAIDDPVPCVIADLPSDFVDFTADAADDAGTLTISNGGNVSSGDVTTYGLGSLSVVLNEAYVVDANKDPYYAVTGSGTFWWDYLTVSIDSTVYELIVESGATGVDFWLTNPSFTFPEGFDVVLADGYEDYFTVSFNADDGILTVWYAAALPEPSMFGLLLGISALALTATRRRRRKAA